ncbi:MAG: DNA-directed RNA polymerase subunit omega [Planctomycetota bacterium]
MDEAVLHDLSRKLGGRFKLAALVQKRLVQLLRERHPVITEHSGGLPVRLVVQEIAEGKLQLVAPDGTVIGPGPEQLAEMAAAATEDEAGGAPAEAEEAETETEGEEEE